MNVYDQQGRLIMVGAPPGTTLAQALAEHARQETAGIPALGPAPVPGIDPNAAQHTTQQAPITATGLAKAAGQGLGAGLQDFLTFPAKATTGLGAATQNAIDWVRRGGAPAVGGGILPADPADDPGPTHLESMAAKVQNLDETTKHALPLSDYVPQNAAERYVDATANGVGGALLGPTKQIVGRVVGGVAGKLAGQAATQAGLPDPVISLVQAAPNILGGVKEVMLPDRAALRVKAAVGGPNSPQLQAANDQMATSASEQQIPVGGSPVGPVQPITVPAIPILPGQAFGADHPMAALQRALMSDPKVGPKLQDFTRNQRDVQIPAATNADPTAGPVAPYQQAYADASTAPVSTGNANALAGALARVVNQSNLTGAPRTTALNLAKLPVNGVGGNPVTNLGQVDDVAGQIAGSAPAAAAQPTPNSPGMISVVGGFLRRQDGRFASAQDAEEAVQAKVKAANVGTDIGAAILQPAPETGAEPASLAASAAKAVGGYGVPYGLGQLASAVIKARQTPGLGAIMSDPTGKLMNDAASYSPTAESLGQLAQAVRLAASPTWGPPPLQPGPAPDPNWTPLQLPPQQ